VVTKTLSQDRSVNSNEACREKEKVGKAARAGSKTRVLRCRTSSTVSVATSRLKLWLEGGESGALKLKSL
jgi:hypothetical protein